MVQTAQNSVDLTVFDRKTPRNSAAMSPFAESNLKFTNSPEYSKVMLTSNLNSPLEKSSRIGSSAFLPLQSEHNRSFSGTNMSPFPNLTEKSIISEGNYQYEQSPLDRKLFESVTPKRNLVHTFSQPNDLLTDRSVSQKSKFDNLSVINREYPEQEEDQDIQDKLYRLEEETRELIKPGHLLMQTYDTESSGMSKDLDKIYNTMMEKMKSDSQRFSTKEIALPPKHPQRQKNEREEQRRSHKRSTSNERNVLEAIPNFENKRRKSHCCKHKHHSKNKKKSVKLQTNFEATNGKQKYNKKLEVRSNLQPRYIDQATSPTNTHVSSLIQKYSQKDSFDYGLSSFDSDLRPLDDLPSISSGRASREDFAHETEQSKLGATFALENKFHTSALKFDPNIDFDQLLVYAQTPPRPILASEASVPIIHELSSKGGEFYLISQLFLKESCEVKSVTKTYTYSLQRVLNQESDFFSSGRVVDFLGTSIMFYTNTIGLLDSLCKNPEGFGNCFSDMEALLFSSSLRNVDDLFERNSKTMRGLRQVLITVVTSRSLKKINGNIYSLDDRAKAIPAYLVQYFIK